MNKLEQIAKQHFEAFTLKHNNGVEVSWYYLPKERRLAWMKDVLDFYTDVINTLDKQIVFEKKIAPNNTSFAVGKEDGIRVERLRYKVLLAEIKHQLTEEYKGYEESEK
jgi:hypothetical protein